ncbi:MAG TPA: hypothetical protein VGX23_01565 [Actinocrinis sp.]|nr:hypothetical protein [Actinocrinis sp.]
MSRPTPARGRYPRAAGTAAQQAAARATGPGGDRFGDQGVRARSGGRPAAGAGPRTTVAGPVRHGSGSGARSGALRAGTRADLGGVGLAGRARDPGSGHGTSPAGAMVTR